MRPDCGQRNHGQTKQNVNGTLNLLAVNYQLNEKKAAVCSIKTQYCYTPFRQCSPVKSACSTLLTQSTKKTKGDLTCNDFNQLY